jgi:hypothetical protein
MTPEEIESKVIRSVIHFRSLEKMKSSMLGEIKWQYKDMAQGGDSGELGFEENGKSSCREVNYPGYPNTFFQQVRDLMGWS